MALVVWGISTCETVKKAQAFLDAEGIAYQKGDLRKTPPDKATVRRWVEAFGVQKLKNTSGGSYRALPDDKSGWSDAQWIEAFTDDAMLIKRPVIERDSVPVSVGFRDDAKALLRGR